MTTNNQLSRRAKRRGVETRANYAGTKESRRFDAAISHHRSAIRSSSASSTGAVVTGVPIVYESSYLVHDSFGSYQETMQVGVARSVLAKNPDVRFLINHGEGGTLPLARTPSTMTLNDTPTGLHIRATLDTRQTAAADLVLALDRGDVSQMSCAFVVADGGDEWSEDFQKRTIRSFAELLDVSAVTYPASPSTSISTELGKKRPTDDWPAGAVDSGPSTQDGTRALALELDLLALARRPKQKPRRPYHGIR